MIKLNEYQEIISEIGSIIRNAYTIPPMMKSELCIIKIDEVAVKILDRNVFIMLYKDQLIVSSSVNLSLLYIQCVVKEY